ncbi:uncharacterized protein LOC143022240 isoform X2 [Oratosquilla oratoria]|uniref:uncharacterized protein LOC143022240 isoform X2 n=1 Tax=Oratosquilla oratoria TaxID=337810 RepID=UPI003F76840A
MLQQNFYNSSLCRRWSCQFDQGRAKMVAAELLKAKQELMMKRRKLRRYDKFLKSKKHVQETLMKHKDEFQCFEIEQSGIPSVFKDAEVTRMVTFRVGSPDIIDTSVTSGESSRDSIDIKEDEDTIQTEPSDGSVHLQQEGIARNSPKITSSPEDTYMDIKLGAEDLSVDDDDVALEKIQNGFTEVSFDQMEFEEGIPSEFGKDVHNDSTKEKEKCELSKDAVNCKSLRKSEAQCCGDLQAIHDKKETSENCDNRDSETSTVLEDVIIKRKCSQKQKLRCLQRSQCSNEELQSEGSPQGNNSVISAVSRLKIKSEVDTMSATKGETNLVAPCNGHTFVNTNKETTHNYNNKLVQIDKCENSNSFLDKHATGQMKEVSNEKCVDSVTVAEKYNDSGGTNLLNSSREFFDYSGMDDLTQVCSDNKQSRLEIDLKESIQHYLVSYGKVLSTTLTSVLYGKREVLYLILIQCKCVSLWISEGDQLYLDKEVEESSKTSEQQLMKIKNVSKTLHSFADVENGVRVQVTAWPGEEEVRFAVLQPCTLEEVNLTYFQYDASGSWIINSAKLDFNISTKWTALSAFATGEWELTICFYEKSLDTTTPTGKATDEMEEKSGSSLLGADLYSVELDLTYSRKWHKWQLAYDVQKHGKLRPAPASLVALQTTDEGSLCCWLCDEGLSIFNMKKSQILCEVPIVNMEVNYSSVLHLAATVKDTIFLVMQSSCSEELELLALNPMNGMWKTLSSWTSVDRINCLLLSTRGIYSLHEDFKLVIIPFHNHCL